MKPFDWGGVSLLSKTVVALSATVLLAACAGHGETAQNSVIPGTQQQSSHISPSTVSPKYGGGSTLAALIYRQWFDYYGVSMPPDPQGASNGLPVNGSFQYYYASVGSGAGQNAFLEQTSSTSTPGNPPIYCPGGVTTCYPYPSWQFSGSDATLNSSQISCYQAGGSCGGGVTLASAVQPARGQYVQIPTLITPITIFYNPSGQTVPAGGLQLSRNTYCGIWEGAITSWGDPTITADNGGVQVSTQPITRVVRSDGSGTTFLLSNHLNTVCQGLANAAYDWTGGVGTTVTWPGTVATGSGSGGVVSTVTSTPGGIGYVGPSYVAPVVSGGLPTARLQNQYQITNHLSTFVGQSINTTQNAFIDVAPPVNSDPYDLALLLPNPTHSGAYPIVGFTWLEIYQCYPQASGQTAIKDFVDWYAAGGPADTILKAQGVAPLSAAWKSSVRSIMSHVLVGPKSGICSI